MYIQMSTCTCMYYMYIKLLSLKLLLITYRSIDIFGFA